MTFRKKPVMVEAFRLGQRGEPTPAPDWFPSPTAAQIQDEGIIISTLEGDMLARWGDWIIQGVNGEIYPCKPDIFQKTYEPVEEA